MEISKYLGIVRTGEEELAEVFLALADRHYKEPDVRERARQLAAWSRAHVQALEPLVQRYGDDTSSDPDRVRAALLHGARMGGVGLLRDLQDTSALATHVRMGWTALNQAARSLHDPQLEEVTTSCGLETDRQIAWLCTMFKHAAPQALIVPADKEQEVKGLVAKPMTGPAIPEAMWGPLAAGGLVAVVAVLAVLAGQQPWLVPSLGPTAYMAAENPAHPVSRLYNTIVGHLLGLVAGFASVFVFGALSAPGVITDHKLVPARALAAVLAIVLTIGLAPALRASHPPAAATTLLVALGAFKTLNDAISVMIGVVLIALAAEGVRRARLGEFRVDPRKQDERRPSPMYGEHQ